MFDEVVIEDQHAPCNKFYGQYSNVIAIPFADCKESLEDSKLVSCIDMDGICEYKFDCSFEYHPVTHENTQFQGMCIFFPKLNMKPS